MDRRSFLKNAATWATPASGSSHCSRRPLGQAGIDMAKRFCMIRVPRRAWLVGLGLAAGIILAAGGSAAADPPKPSCTSVTDTASGSVFKILHNQTYALCAVSHCFVFGEVAYCKCDVKFGESISLALDYDRNKNVCTVNVKGVNNGYMVSTFSVPPSNPHEAIYTCPGGSNGSLCPMRWRDLLQKHPGAVISRFRALAAKRDRLLLSDHRAEPGEPGGLSNLRPFPL